ncbi:hypothetical protein OROGR_026437 [Orobanche gracilis]
MARRAAGITLLRRFLPTISTPPFFCPARPCSGGGGVGEVDLSIPPYNMISYFGDWYLTEEAMKHPGMDYRHWFVRIARPSLIQGYTDEEKLHYFYKTLRRALPDLRPCAVLEKIYKVEFDPKKVGFGCEVDWHTADKLKALRYVEEVTPDYYPDPNYKDYGGELVVDGKIVERREREPNLDLVVC